MRTLKERNLDECRLIRRFVRRYRLKLTPDLAYAIGEWYARKHGRWA